MGSLARGQPPDKAGTSRVRPSRNGLPPPLDDLEAARIVRRVAATREPPPPDEFKRLPPEWAEGCLLAEEDGLEGVGYWLKALRVRLRADPQRFEAIGAALAEAEAEGPDAGPAVARDGAPPFSLDLIDSAEFFGREYEVDWLVDDVVVRGEAGAIGGPSKSLKTSILLDLSISLATATRFLEKFPVRKAIRVGLISGESGRRIIQANARNMCAARGISTEDLGGIFWGFKLPQLNNRDHLTVLRKAIEDHGLEFIALDPFYLTLLAGSAGINPSNMFEVGPLLQEVANLCLDAGCTPNIAHHFTKKRDDPFGQPELTDLAYAGIGQFIRQWMLVAPRERFNAEVGLFKLFFHFGGSAGHSGELAVDIEVGKLTKEFDGRKWVVSVASPSEERAAKQEQRQVEQERKAEEKRLAKEAEREREECSAVADAVAALKAEPGRKATVKRLRGLLSWNDEKANRILVRMEKGGLVKPAQVAVPVGQGKTREFPGYELVDDPEKIL